MRKQMLLPVLLLVLAVAATTMLWAQNASAKAANAPHAQCAVETCCQPDTPCCCDAACCVDGKCTQTDCTCCGSQMAPCATSACCGDGECCNDGACQNCATGCCTQTDTGMQCTKAGNAKQGCCK